MPQVFEDKKKLIEELHIELLRDIFFCVDEIFLSVLQSTK
jgi:hypothetical protein